MVVAKQFPYPKLTVVNPEEYTARIVRYLVTQLCLVDSFAAVEWWRDYCTVSDVIEQSGVTERYLANAIISDKLK